MTDRSNGVGVIVSRADRASVHIGEQLRSIADWTAEHDGSRPDDVGGGTVFRTDGAELREFDGLHLELGGAADPFNDPALLVFASRHSGDTGPLLSAHFTGNVGPAKFGGETGHVARAAPNALRAAIASLDRHAPPDYEVTMECTHHGPTDLDVPSLFVELGSDEEQWADPAGATAVARAILDLREVQPIGDRQVVGFGGGHYAPRFSRVVRETDWAVGHVAADWSLEAAAPLDAAVIRRLFDRSDTDRALIDGDRSDLRARIRNLGYEPVSETWLRESSGVSLALVDRVETTLGGVDDGIRFGAIARDGVEDPDAVDLVSLHPDLLGAVNGIDVDATLEAVSRTTIAFETADGGSRVAGPLVVHDTAALDRLVEDLLSILRRRNESAEPVDGSIVVRDRVFDPDRARDLGVPEGPAFGRLTAGEAVEVNGTTVDPDEVHTPRTIRLPILADRDGSDPDEPGQGPDHEDELG